MSTFTHFTIPLPMFKAMAHVVYAEDAKRWPDAASLLVDHYGKLRDEIVHYVNYCAEGEPANACCTHFGKTIVILLQREHLRESTLVHECVHAAQFLEESAAIKDSNGEFQAYTAAFLFSQVKEGLNREGVAFGCNAL